MPSTTANVLDSSCNKNFDNNLICFDEVDDASLISKDSLNNMNRNLNCSLFSNKLKCSQQNNSMGIFSDCIIELPCNLSIKNTIKLLVDTGATISLIKVDVLKDEVRINSNKAMEIQGIFDVSNLTIGETKATLQINDKFHDCNFQVISNTKSINTDGILGMDFLSNNAIIDLYHNSISFLKTTTINNIVTPVLSESTLTKNNTSGSKGEKMLQKMGYIANSGLGKDGQGIRVPIEVIVKNDRVGIGFESKKNNILDSCCYEETPEEEMQTIFSINLFDDACKEKPKSRLIPNISSTFYLEPRSETVVSIETNITGDHFCESKQIQSNVYLANAVVRPKNGCVDLCVINSNSTPVKIENFKPNLLPIHQFRVYSYQHFCKDKPQLKSELNRYKLLMQNLNLDENLNNDEFELLKHLFQDFNDIFHLPGDKLTCTNVKQFKLPLIEGTDIVNRKQYRLPETYKIEIRKQIKQLLDDDIIEESYSPFNNPILLVPKKGIDDQGSKLYRLCVDFRELNKIAKPFSFPLPRIEDILDQLGKSTYFTTLDLSKGFHQVEIVEADREKTAFSTDMGHYQFKRCPFGLKTMPGFFQSLLNGILTGLQGIKCFIYLDDVVIFSRSLDEHYSKLTEIFQRLRATNLKLNPKKCSFLQKEILYLGHICSSEGVKPDDKLLTAVKDFPAPVNIKQLQSFLGLANYYRKFIKGFSIIASPLHKLLSKNSKFEWNSESKNAFDSLKIALTTPPVLAYPQFDKLFTITCDASLVGLGAVLEQEGRVISYASRSLLPAEKRWSATELELNAIVFGCRTFNCYVLGKPFKVFTDHMPLRGIMKVKDTSARIIRLQQKLAQYDLEIIYKRGKDNLNADCLSRRPDNEFCLAVTRSAAKNVQPSNVLQQIDASVNDNNKDISEGDDEDYESVDDSDSDTETISDPDDKLNILKAFHDNPLGGHFGVSKTYKKIRRKFKWRGMKKYIASHIRKCKKCQQNKAGRGVKMNLRLTNVSDKPFDKVYVDIVGPLPMTLNGNKYIVSMVDDLTRFVEFTPVPDQTAETIARALYEDILSRYTIPRSLVTDNGSNFVGSVFKSVCKLLGVKKLRTTPYHPQGNLVERQHSTLGNYLRNFIDGHPGNWDLFLRSAAHAYNNTPHESTGFPPMELLFGFVAEIPTNLKRKPEPIYNFNEYKSELRYKLQKSFELARKHLLKKKEVAKEYYDKKASPCHFKVGDKVLIKNECRTSKFSSHWNGPYEVLEVHDDINITISQRGKAKRVHANRLKLFYD